MGKFDTVTKAYMSQNEHFADLLNFYLYDGEQRIQGSSLRELDPTELSVILEDGSSEHVQKYLRNDQ